MEYSYYLNNFKDDNKYVEVAFFGGSFTGIEEEIQEGEKLVGDMKQNLKHAYEKKSEIEKKVVEKGKNNKIPQKVKVGTRYKEKKKHEI